MKRLISLLAVTAAVGMGIWWWTVNGDSTDSEVTERSTAPESKRPPPDLRGTVTDASGTPVSGATIEITDGGTRRTSETAADGSYAFRNLDPGSYRLDARAEEFVPPGPRSVREIRLEISSESGRNGPREIDLTLHRPARLEGRVVAGSSGVGDVRLSLVYLFAEGFRGGLDPFTLSGEATTSDDGSFELSNLAPGRIRILAASRDHPTRRSREIFLEAGETKTGVVIDLEPQGALAGTVTDSEGNPVNAEITVTGDALRNRRKARADESGSYRIPRLSGGTYDLEVRAKGFRTRILRKIPVPRDDEKVRDIRLERGTGLFGRVLGPDGNPVSRAKIRFRRNDETKWRGTDKSGRFQWKNPPGGSWSGRAYSPKYGASSSVRLQPGRSALLRLESGGWIRGRIVDPSGEPVPGAKVGVASMVVEGTHPFGRRAVGVRKIESESGKFRFGPLRPGRYQLTATKTGYAAAETPQLTVSPGETNNGVELVLGLGGTVAGVVRSNANGEPIAGAQVSAFDMTSPFEARTVRTDQQGRFRLERIPAGRRSLRIQHERHLTRVVSGLQIPEGGTVQRDVRLRRKKKGQKFGFRGIGASLRRTEEGVVIRRILPGGGAKKNGLKRGDVIRTVDGEPVGDAPLSRVVQKIRGRAGEPVELTVERDGRGKFDVQIVRDRVVVKGRRGKN